MSPDDLKNLIGGYASGNLSDQERQALFEAALDDQDLFNELAREHSIKEILDDPASKSRLIAALSTNPKPAWWRKPFLLPLAGAIAVAIFALVWIKQPKPQPIETAAVQQPVPAPEQQAKSEPAPPPPPKPQPPAAKKRDLPPPSPPAELKEADAANRTQTTSAPRAAAPMAAPIAAPMAALRAKAAPPKLAFDYLLEPEYLTLTFSSDGYFSIHFSPGNDTIVGTHVTAGSSRRLFIPNNSTEADIVFSAGPQTTSGGVSLTREDRKGSIDDPARERIELLLKFYP